MQAGDPQTVIKEDQPAFSAAEAIRIARDRYGLEVTVAPLVSERDQNFRLKTAGGDEYVLKIANAAESPVVTDFQIQALLHISEQVRELGLPIHAPEVLRTLDGAVSFQETLNDSVHTVRAVTFLAGQPLGDDLPSPALARNMGACLAHLGRALAGFEHAGSHQDLLWDMQQALKLRDLIEFVSDPVEASTVAEALNDFETHVAPSFASLRSQVIHSDLNPDNVLVDPDNASEVAGVIDFGDMLYAPLAADVAIACSYLRVRDGDPLQLIAEFIAGYNDVTPLEPGEIDVLFELVQARLCASKTILDWRAALRGADDPYLAARLTGVDSSIEFLTRLRAVPREHARQVFRQVCASRGCKD